MADNNQDWRREDDEDEGAFEIDDTVCELVQL